MIVNSCYYLYLYSAYGWYVTYVLCSSIFLSIYKLLLTKTAPELKNLIEYVEIDVSENELKHFVWHVAMVNKKSFNGDFNY